MDSERRVRGGHVSILALAVGIGLLFGALAWRALPPSDVAGPAPGDAGTLYRDNIPLPAGIVASVVPNAAVASPLDGNSVVVSARSRFGSAVGQKPLVRFLAVSGLEPLGEATPMFVVFSTDASVPLFGPAVRPKIEPAATFAWVFVTPSGEPLNAMYLTYLTPESVPGVPAE